MEIYTYSIGWFSTGRDKAARDLLEEVHSNIINKTIDAKISYVFCNREEGEAEESDRFIDFVKGLGLQIICFSSRDFKSEMRKLGRHDHEVLKRWRREYDREVVNRLRACEKISSQFSRPKSSQKWPEDGMRKVDLIVLAGYMLIVGDEMCKEYDMINLHPAAPNGPAGTWQEVIWKLIEEKKDETGVMMHLVTEELDKGPPVSYCTFPIKGDPFNRLWEEMEERLKRLSLEELIKEEGETNSLFHAIRQQGVIRELPLIVCTLKRIAEGKIRVKDKKVVDEKGSYINGLSLNKEIESYFSNIKRIK